MDMGDITAAIGSLKVAGEMAVGLINLKTMNEVQTVALKLNEQLIAAQHQIFAANAAQATLIQRVDKLEKQIADMEAWKTEKQRYQMANPLTGGIVYALKRSMCNGEPAHYICANCYENSKRSILQDGREKDKPATFLLCPVCKTQLPTGYNGFPSRKYAEDISTE